MTATVRLFSTSGPHRQDMGGGGGGRGVASDRKVINAAKDKLSTEDSAGGSAPSGYTTRVLSPSRSDASPTRKEGGVCVASGRGVVVSVDDFTVINDKEVWDESEWVKVTDSVLNFAGEDQKLIIDDLDGGVQLDWKGRPLRIPAGVRWNELGGDEKKSLASEYLSGFIKELQQRGLTLDQIALRLSFMHQGAFAMISRAVNAQMMRANYLPCNPTQIPEDLKRPLKIVMNIGRVKASGRLYFQKDGKGYSIDVEQWTTFSTPVMYEMKNRTDLAPFKLVEQPPEE